MCIIPLIQKDKNLKSFIIHILIFEKKKKKCSTYESLKVQEICNNMQIQLYRYFFLKISFEKNNYQKIIREWRVRRRLLQLVASVLTAECEANTLNLPALASGCICVRSCMHLLSCLPINNYPFTSLLQTPKDHILCTLTPILNRRVL